jgi:hypothetical protein
MRLKMTALVVGLAVLTGCSAASKFDGTWLFKIDPNASFGGTCADDVDPAKQPEVLGTGYQLVDIFGTDDGRVIVLFDNDILEGTPDGSEFEAEYTLKTSGDGWTDEYGIEISATKESGILSGTMREYEREVDEDGEWTCSAEFDYTAEIIVSDEDRYLGD